jgi:hypothetical protein
VDSTQTNLQNTRFANYQLASYFSENASDSHVQFATRQPAMFSNGIVHGNGLVGAAVDHDTALRYTTETDREQHKLQLHPRAFASVPYLGRGSCNPDLESQMRQGDSVAEKKSVGTIMDKSFMGYTLYPVDADMQARTTDATLTVQESALDGWVRGGSSTREMNYPSER